MVFVVYAGVPLFRATTISITLSPKSYLRKRSKNGGWPSGIKNSKRLRALHRSHSNSNETGLGFRVWVIVTTMVIIIMVIMIVLITLNPKP